MDGCYYPDSMLDWCPSRLFLPEDPQIPETLSPALRTIEVVDAGRDWAGTQNINVIFSESCTGTAIGWSCTVNGVAKTLTYVSGSPGQTWVMQIGSLIKHGDVIRLTYDTAAGGTVSTTGSVQITGISAVELPDTLSKRIRFILCGSDDKPVESEAVKAAIMEYDSGTMANANWMFRVNKATITTDANGQFDMEYNGVAPVGGKAYVAVIRATESMIVADTVT